MVLSQRSMFIVKTGATFPETARRRGDFEDWTRKGLADGGAGMQVVDIVRGDALPSVQACAGVVVTGSHAMVTDLLPWSVRLEAWIVEVLQARIPFLGICYGHQLLGHAAGGLVGNHPAGPEIGTVPIRLTAEGRRDPLFKGLPDEFAVHATHTQSVLKLPPGAVLLADNGYEPHHAFRLGPCAWGVQFHPEYDPDIMRDYILAQAAAIEAAGRSMPEMLAQVAPTPNAAALLMHFADFAWRCR